MYINDKWNITNTPTKINAAYNTWTHNVRGQARYQSVPRYFIDHLGNVQKWDKWENPKTTKVCGGRFKATPTRTGSFYIQNVII